MKRIAILTIIAFSLVEPARTHSPAAADSLLQHGNLSDCIRYALAHQPVVHQALLNEAITERVISTKLADWYPQLSFGFNFEHLPQLPVSIVQGNAVKLGVQNTSAGTLSLSQTIFNRDVLLASSTATEARQFSSEQTTSTKIDVVVNVSKAYYAVLATREQIDLVNEDIHRLEQSVADTYAQYKGGIVDKTDYQRATIALNNAKAQRLQNEELLKSRLASLKDLMGYRPSADLTLAYDTTAMEREAMIDTTQPLVPGNRVEFRLLKTERSLQESNLDYSEWSFLPSLSAFGAYNLVFQNNEFSQLYGKQYPNSNFGLQLSFPIFEGGKRIQQIGEARLQLEQIDEDLVSLNNAVSAEYTAAMAGYKSNLNNYRVLKENVTLARDVYNTIQLQYKAGTKTYLDVITAETDLRTAQASETDALYAVLSSKLDVQKALGTIHYE